MLTRLLAVVTTLVISSSAFSEEITYSFYDVTAVHHEQNYFTSVVKGKDSVGADLEAKYSFNGVSDAQNQHLYESCRQSILMTMNSPGKYILGITINNLVGFNRTLVSCELQRK